MIRFKSTADAAEVWRIIDRHLPMVTAAVLERAQRSRRRLFSLLDDAIAGRLRLGPGSEDPS